MSEALIPNRDCGGCTVCCTHLSITSPALTKPAGVLCTYCTEGSGCGIYETRPSVCRTWHCGWRTLALDDSWRPDRCGILISLTQERIPSHFEKRVGLKFQFVDSLQSAQWEPFVCYIASLIENRIPVFLSVPGPDGHDSAVTFLNDGMAAAIASRNYERIAQEILHALEMRGRRKTSAAPV
jgi:hypothetical protein